MSKKAKKSVDSGQKENQENIYDFRKELLKGEENSQKHKSKKNNLEDEETVELKIDDNIPKPKQHLMSKVRIAILSVIAIVIIVLLASYTTNSNFRNYVDSNILKKQVAEDSLAVVEIKSDDNPTIFAYDGYVGILSKSVLNIYNSKAISVSKLDIDISNPVYEIAGKYIAIAENGGSKFYIVNNTQVAWNGSVDGNISKININENGYVTVIASNSTYTSIVILFNSNGEELFKTYLPSTYAMCAAVSTNNSYLAIGEVDYSGTVLKSNVRIMDIASAERVYNYSSDNNNIITNIKYSDKENAVCTFTNSVVCVSSNSEKEIYAITDDTCFVDNQVSGNLAVLEKQSSGLFSYEYNLKFIGINSNSENLCTLNNLPSGMKSSQKLVGLNYGNEIDIVNLNGTIKKNYKSSAQIKDIAVGDSVIGIIYKDKVGILGV